MEHTISCQINTYRNNLKKTIFYNIGLFKRKGKNSHKLKWLWELRSCTPGGGDQDVQAAGREQRKEGSDAGSDILARSGDRQQNQ